MANIKRDNGPRDAGATERENLLNILERANRASSTTSFDDLCNQMLDLMMEVCAAEIGTLYLLKKQSGELTCQVIRGDQGSRKFKGLTLKQGEGTVWEAIEQGSPLIIDDLVVNKGWLKENGQTKSAKLRNAIILPLVHGDRAIGAVQIFNYTHPETEVMSMLASRLASELDKIVLLKESQQRGERLQSLVDILTHIGNTLDRDQLLTQIVESGRRLLNTEACSIFMSEVPGGDQFLYFASPPPPTIIKNVRIPAKRGIIGAVVSTGKTALIKDVVRDPRYYPDIDNLTIFKTSSMIAVPIWATTLDIGQSEFKAQKHVIGGIEALNKKQGEFDQEDVELLEMLAAEATTILQLADLHSNATEIFLDLIKALSSAIDAKDPYTEGHSQRVSAFSIAMGKTLGLSSKDLNHLKTGSLLHDLGKIGVPDQVLKKAGRLSVEEFEQVKKHTLIGETILSNVRLLKEEVPALVEHHERLDGSGYPRGLAGAKISSIGKIVAVADVFDAMTSERTYRDAIDASEVLDYLGKNADVLFDGSCVEALFSVYQNGEILLAN